MTPTPGKKEFSMEVRLLIAFGLMAVVLFVTPYFMPQEPKKPPAVPAKTSEPPPAKPDAPAAAPAPAQPAAVKAPATGAVVKADKETPVTVETDLYKVTFSNRGAVARSWILKKYKDGKGHPLDLVNPKAAEKTGAPFALEFKSQKPATDPNWAYFVAEPDADGLGVGFSFSDGQTQTKKTFRFQKSGYLAEVSTEVLHNGVGLPHSVAWRGGFGDATIVNAQAARHSLYYDLGNAKLNVQDVKAAKNGPVSASGRFSFGGLEDPYFAAVFLPKGNGNVEVTTYSDTVPPAVDGADEAHIGAAVGGEGQNAFSLFAGPKDFDLLKKIDPKLDQLIDWGWWGFIARPLFLVLNWTNDQFIHNYGWSIILITFAINMLLMPLKFTGMKSAKKMQAIQPELQAINARYKNVGLRDPKNNDKNAEIMELYKKHGVNPVGGCLPMVLQLPFFFAFYKVLTVAIEMRGAQWLWVTDLSQPETIAIRVLPIVLIVTQFVSQKMTPAAGMDPAQQRIMLIMPLALGYMFWFQSSGLVLYWLTGNLVAIAQQWFTNRMMPSPAPATVTVKPAPKKKNGR